MEQISQNKILGGVMATILKFKGCVGIFPIIICVTLLLYRTIMNINPLYNFLCTILYSTKWYN